MAFESGQTDIEFKRIAAAHLVGAHALSRAVDWPHRLEDWQFIESLGSGFVALSAGRIVGTAMYWKHDARHASIGMVIVSPSMQGRGIGGRLMSLLLDVLKGRTVFLNSTEAGMPLYEKNGFAVTGTIEQHQGVVRDLPIISLPSGERLRPIGASDALKLTTLASRASGVSRAVLLPALLASAEGIVLDRDGVAIGFALFRRYGRGYAIGPVIAPDLDRARALISHWIGTRTRKFIRIDVPVDAGLTAWLVARGLARVGSVVQMVRGAAPACGPDARTFAIISQALG